MNEKPQTTREGEQEDLLEQIITRGLDQMNAPAHATAAEEAPPEVTPPAPEPEGDAALSADRKKNRRSAVYLYLLILFGAAFLMLLLAYFVQRRNSETTISDLHNSMNLSRTELLDEIKALEEEKAALNEEIDRLNSDLIEWQKRYDAQVQDANGLYHQFYVAQEDLYAWNSFWELEQYYQAGDYESCAAIIILQMQGQYVYRTPNGAEERQEEIVKAVIKAGILGEDYLLHPDDYEELLDAYFDRLGVLTESVPPATAG